MVRAASFLQAISRISHNLPARAASAIAQERALRALNSNRQRPALIVHGTSVHSQSPSQIAHHPHAAPASSSEGAPTHRSLAPRSRPALPPRSTPQAAQDFIRPSRSAVVLFCFLLILLPLLSDCAWLFPQSWSSALFLYFDILRRSTVKPRVRRSLAPTRRNAGPVRLPLPLSGRLELCCICGRRRSAL